MSKLTGKRDFRERLQRGEGADAVQNFSALTS